MTKHKSTAPAHLRPATREWFDSVLHDYLLEPHHLRILQNAAEAWDRGQAARETIAKKGSTYDDRFGAPHARPEVAIEAAARRDFMRAIRELDLDFAGPPGAARPPAIPSNRRIR